MAEPSAAKGKRPRGGQQPPAALVAARRRREERPSPQRTVPAGDRPQPARPKPARSKPTLAAVPRDAVRAREEISGLSGSGYAILGVTLLMFLYGMVMIFSASSGMAFHIHGSSYYFLVRQAIWFGIGLAAMAAMAYFDYHRMLEISPVLVMASIAALLAVPVVGTEAFGSKRSINLGPAVFQPSEFVKLALILFAVYTYSRKKGRLDSWKEIIVPVILVTSLACLLIVLEPDLGSAIIASIAVYIVLFMAGAPLNRLAIMAAAGVGATAIFIMSSGYRKARFLAFLDPWAAPKEGGFHIIQSMVALGSGSASGMGLGMSRQKFFYLPNAHTDFIFSIIGEELGIIGTAAVLVLFVSFVFLGFRVARGAPDRMGRILAISITCLIGAQALINMGAATGVMPITGVTLPFFSYGGSSLLVCMCLAGILINIARQDAALTPPADGRKKRERGDMRGRNRRPSPSPTRPGRGVRVA